MNLINKLIKAVVGYIRKKVVNPYYCRKLSNKNFSLISNNCNGTFILHDLNLRYTTPTINLYIPPSDFIRFCSRLSHYLSLEIDFIQEEGVECPIGILEDVKIYFVHYKSDNEARIKWNDRRCRINYDDIYILMTERDGCNYKMIDEFNRLPFKNKLVLTHKDYNEFNSTYKIYGFEDLGEVGFLYEYKHIYSLRRQLYNFDFVNWFNGQLNI